ncbi:YciI family protein [Rhizobium sp. S152]|uniref:YciI family protein n=1 Tax=Rhizobium sp. S152 TaxID=3055038 RepID=UPI0025A98A39|nr:YciI family protein [Rhizobium sp. S152]MDM9628005.1 YciI family protein [Rhizobium sp. S152]
MITCFRRPENDHLRAAFLDAHKAHLRSGVVDVVMAGSLKGGQGGSMIVANVTDLHELAAFNEDDPFVREGIYQRSEIYEWTITLDKW